MGIDFPQIRLLANLSTRFQPRAGGRSLMLGRQKTRLGRHNHRRITIAMRQQGHSFGWKELAQEDGYAETLFRAFGFGQMETMDASNYEGASIIHDLNKPVPEHLEGQFDFIYDGGTIEHVFNVPVALTSIYRMLKPGGRFISVNGMNGWPGHGFYQFGPELAYSFWARGCGCRIHRCLAVTRDGERPDVELPDAAVKGSRIRIAGKLPSSRVYLYYEVEKTADTQERGEVLQSDYLVRWTENTDDLQGPAGGPQEEARP